MKNKILEKIKKLLRLAKSSNPNEASLALSRAQKLMEEHGIGADAPELSGVCDATITSQIKAQTPPRYIGYLAQSIKLVFGCDFYFRPTFTQMVIVFIGHDQRPEIAGYVYTVLERQLTKARKEYLSGLSKKMKRTNKTARADQFCEGWTIGVHNKIKAFALSPEELNQIEAFKSNVVLECSHARAAKGKGQSHAEARHQGYEASKDVTLNHGVNRKETYKLEAS